MPKDNQERSQVFTTSLKNINLDKIKAVKQHLSEISDGKKISKAKTLNTIVEMGYLAYFTIHPPKPPIEPELQQALLEFAHKLLKPD